MRWYKELNQKEKKTFVAAFGGWAIDALDFMIFTFVIAAIMQLWGINKGEAGLLGTVTLLFSAIGGWGAGILADRYGRVKILQITILWFSICTVLTGFSQNFEQFFVLRALQGLGFGGEWAVGSVLMGEIIRAEHRGKAVGTVQSGWAIGWGIAALLYTVAFSILPIEWAWRTLFWVGALPALLVLYIRKHVPEPEIFKKKLESNTDKVSPWAIFSPDIIKTTIPAAILCTGAQGGYYAVTTWLPTYLKVERHLSVMNTGGYLLVIILGSFCGYIAGAYFTDRFGRKANLVFFSLLSCLSIYLYTVLPLSDEQMLFLGFPLGFAASGIFSGIGAYLTELFPSRIRANGQGFAYNFGRGIGALFPSLVGYLSQSTGLALAIGLFGGGAYVVVLLSTLFLPETKGKVLVE
ncbi:MFS transporter [Paralcaligenes ginsengisoli]|jgi:MFS family permease